MSSNVRWRRRDGVFDRSLLTFSVVAAPEQGSEAVTLSGTGFHIWSALEEGGSIDEIAAVVAVGFGVSVDEIVDDVGEFLAQLEDAGLADQEVETQESQESQG